MSKYVVVGFRLDSERSVFYRRVDSVNELLNAVRDAFEKYGSDFISVRKVVKR